jgi:hypothetical protein
MARKTGNFTDKERERLRARLRAHAARYDLSPQKISDQIATKTGFEAALDGGRKRVERFLKATHKQPEDFIAAVASYLNDVAPEDVEESAIAFARLLAQPHDKNADLSELIGQYRAYVRPMRNAPPPPLPAGVGTVIPIEYLEQPRPDFEIAYAIIALTPIDKSNALLVADAVTNVAIDPKIDSFPENPVAISNAGVLVPFGFSGFLMATQSIMETRLYRLTKVADDPLTLRGHLTLNSVEATVNRRRDLQVFDPDYEVEMVKVAGIGDG